MSVRLMVRLSLVAVVGAAILVHGTHPKPASAIGSGEILTAVGGGAGDGGSPTAVPLDAPQGVAVDASGNVYIADTLGCVVRKVTGGVVVTIAGNGGCGYGGDGGPATAASLRGPRGVGIDASGNVYIADTGNCLIRMVTGGTITTVAGSGTCPTVGNESGGDGGPATSAHLWNPSGVAVDGSGTLYIADSGNCRVRKVAGGTITTLAGTTVVVSGVPTSCGYSGDGGPANAAWLTTVGGVALNAAGTVLDIADTDNCRVRQVNLGTGVITTIAGTSICSWSGDGGLATAAHLWNPVGVSLDSSGNVYIADSNNCRIREISAGTITTIAGSGSCGFGGDGGPAGPGVTTLTSGASAGGTALFVAGTAGFAVGNTIRINPGGVTQEDNVVIGLTSSIALQNPLGQGHLIGEQVIRLTPAAAALNVPSGVAVDTSGNVYIADTANCRVREVAGGNMSTLAGTGACGYGGDGGKAVSAWLHSPTGVAVNPAGTTLYFADTNNCVVRKSTGTIITTVAGTGTCGYSGDSGLATSAMLSHPYGVALDTTGNVYIADSDNCRVRKITVSTGIITTVAGNGVCGYGGDGAAATSANVSPLTGIALDGSGNIYLADTGNCVIRKVSAGTITTAAGNGTFCPPSYPPFIGDGGPATASALYYPHGVAVDSAGANFYIADTFNCRVRKVVTGTGIISTIAGTTTCGYSGDNGSGTSAKLNNPLGVSVDGSGNVYIADSDNCRVRQVVSGTISTIAGTGTCWFAGDGGLSSSAAVNHPYALSLDAVGNLYIGDAENNRVRGVYTSGDTDGDGLPNGAEAMIYGTNPNVADTDGDSCNDGKELGSNALLGGRRDPLNLWDFYNVPTPALRKNHAGTRDSGIGVTTDVVALLAYVGLTASSPDYIADYDGNGVADGLQYDRSVSTTPGMPWRSGPPDGGIGVTTDVIAILAQVGTTC